MLDGYLIRLSRIIVVIPGIDIGRCRTRGSAIYTRQEGDRATIEILVCGVDSTRKQDLGLRNLALGANLTA